MGAASVMLAKETLREGEPVLRRRVDVSGCPRAPEPLSASLSVSHWALRCGQEQRDASLFMMDAWASVENALLSDAFLPPFTLRLIIGRRAGPPSEVRGVGVGAGALAFPRARRRQACSR